MKSRLLSFCSALAVATMLLLAAPLISQVHEVLGPSFERFESHLEHWDLSSERAVQFELKDGTTVRGHICATPPPTREFLEELRAVLSLVSEETDGFEVKGKTLARIPLFFHVIQTTSGKGYVTDQQIIEQVQVLNERFKSTGVQFYIDGVEDVVNNTWFKKCSLLKKNGAVNRKYVKMTKKLAVAPRSTVNIYSCQLPGTALGFGIIAGLLPEGHKANGIVLDHLTFPGGPYEQYSKGITGVHEMGHYLGLLHTFYPGVDGMPNGCDGNGDEVADTPFEAEPAYECKPRDSCPQAGMDPIKNFMDYTDDNCRKKFSIGQKIRMLDMTLYYRPGLFGLQ